jgi:glycosyltransferase involved in cell wall biosynthesis
MTSILPEQDLHGSARWFAAVPGFAHRRSGIKISPVIADALPRDEYATGIMPTVSVVMSVYNARRYVARAIRSVRSQTVRDWELLIFDDGSIDGTREILGEYARRDSRIRLFLNEHRGYVTWLNEGLRQARGPFWARMDADDVALPHRFAKQVAYLRQHRDCVAVGADAMQVDADGWPMGRLRVPLTHEQIEASLLEGLGEVLCHPVAMFRRDALTAVGGYRKECELAEDVDLYLRLAEVGRLANLPDVLLRYRRHFASVTASQQTKHGEALRRGLQSAYQRRGLVPPAEEPLRLRRQVRDATRPEMRRYWIEQALRAGCVWTARKHALWLVIETHGSPPAWHLLRSALLSERTPAVAWLKRWRRRLFGARSVTPPVTGQHT